MKSSIALLNRAVLSKNAKKARQKNKELQLDLSREKAFLRTIFPLKKIIRQWDTVVKMKERLRPLFKEYGLYNKGQFLLEIFSKKEHSDSFGVFLAWNVATAKLGVALFEIARSEEKTITGEPIASTSFTKEMLKALGVTVSLSEKELVRRIVETYPIEKHRPQSLLSNEPFDMTGGCGYHSDDWKRACLELSKEGYFDGSENMYRILAKAEEELLVDTQKITVLGTNLKYSKRQKTKEEDENDRGIPTRTSESKIVTIGYLRKMFFDFHKIPFTLEWYKNHSDWKLTCAMINRNRAPIIMVSATS